MVVVRKKPNQSFGTQILHWLWYYPLPNKRTGTIGKKLLRSGGGLAWVCSKTLSEILVGTFIRVGTIL